MNETVEVTPEAIHVFLEGVDDTLHDALVKAMNSVKSGEQESFTLTINVVKKQENK